LASTSGTSPSSGNRRADATRRIGQYQLFEEIGRGAGGVVYRALDNMDRDLAIKELPLPQIRRGELGLPRLAPDEIIEARKRFVNEARAVGKLKHPNIVTVHEFIEEPDSLYLVMEFVPGGSLHKLIGGETPPATGEALGIVCQVAAALDHAHSNGIVHRDIKPGNILVSGRVVKVTDFGIARIVSSETMTLTGVVLGTPAWMAPEQISGSEADAKADQFSLGVVAYQLFGRKLPFAASDYRALMFQIVSAEPASLLEANPDLAPEVDRVIRRALEKNPNQRFASCGAFSHALEQAMLPPAPITRRTVHAKSGANKLLLAVAGLLLAVLAALFFVWRAGVDRRTNETHPVQVADSQAANGLGVEVKKRSGPGDPATDAVVAGATGASDAGKPAPVPVGTDTKTRMQAAQEYVDRKDYAMAEDIYKQVVKTEPNNVEALTWLASVLYREDKIDESAAVMDRIPKRPLHPIEGGDQWRNPKDDLIYVWIPAGHFTMGCSAGDSECDSDEKPAHPVTITRGFRMGQTPVTQEAYQRVTAGSRDPSYGRGAKLPVDVGWNEARSYCQKVDMRLPTEAEWEYAARAGTTGSRYGDIDRIAWYSANSGGRTHPVGLKDANAWGLYDMLGNVWQWTADWNADKYSGNSETDPQGPAGGGDRVLRGSPFFDDPRYARVSNRDWPRQENRRSLITGFRCVGN